MVRENTDYIFSLRLFEYRSLQVTAYGFEWNLITLGEFVQFYLATEHGNHTFGGEPMPPVSTNRCCRHPGRHIRRLQLLGDPDVVFQVIGARRET